ncbi:hypothetical protein BT69DRAFT_1277825 [Atractiella rhizophila]|nr:hypothetical protein BT69DRAFT_1277825 [Atractiella rhizophila]
MPKQEYPLTTKSASQGVKEGHLLWYTFLQLSDHVVSKCVPVSIDHLGRGNPFIICFFEINDIA